MIFDLKKEIQKQKKSRALDRVNQKAPAKSENENSFKLQYLKTFIKSESGESAKAAILDLIERIKVNLLLLASTKKLRDYSKLEGE